MNRGTSLFGYPTVVVINQEQATDVSAMYDAVVERLQRWTANARDLFTWEEASGSGLTAGEMPIQINGLPPMDSITEITENGNVAVQSSVPEEGDIVDEKTMAIDEDTQMDTSIDVVPVKVGPKRDIFNLRLQINHKDYGTRHSVYASNNRFESWDRRLHDAETQPVLLREGDAFFCEFDENMKAFYFGDDRSRWENARWDTWDQFIHPEYEESKKASVERKNRGISLQDCLDEFTKEEKLGEDDLWYCPRCKKHQQATKKFDLWKAPDILVVHLKRFSNSRTLRDKIDTFIDFPVDGLDLGDMVEERKVAKRLFAQGMSLEEFKLRNLDEPLVYDLFGVDEHIGGLGGGHYRAYAFNHITDEWHHFDDSYVTPALPIDAVV
jgi:ubiquitin carboxyl-terminal hydrolase 4/11/15